MMLKIGIFSKVCQVSVKTLRHWDSLNLLKPSHIDPFTSYRYYTIEQVGEVNRILALKGMGLSLEQIGELLREQLSTEDIRRMLRVRHMQLQQEMEQATHMLTLIESRLKQLEYGGNLPGYETVLKAVEALPIYATRQVVPTMEVLVERLEVAHKLSRQREDPRLLAIFHDEGYEREDIDVEIGFAAVGEPPQGDLHLTQLPAVELMACTVHEGAWLTLSQGYVYLGQWIETNGYTITDVGREVFHHIDWEQNHAVTEIQFPIRKKELSK